ncbi:TraR/DksA C4-type zinc finger protein [Acinetobacter seifertii]|uniref:TraR/DksA C4-type zinc finger protein n=1 Tax=Acinetobacter seifertii TaxID=1530123 RepID=A0A7H2QV10_9GAMM|nr:TraR/DksA C4-type zinc finger protein [Acinetobacter seifertii]MBD1220576.1 TraR/DksA C4-type zinc finger protein [Acinetobacter seifertii]MBD1225092.1 TraR/DksA C4-type zinc finger protein [Acinetobacter seifertii]QNX03323.1 TraR/DksA C4-type zinc finger protein [Acinetobacter seifertii]QNX11378.1 TraR/DksA C4-type zinc finger protein [Acinetobacter seifertii]QNX18943.1 TraR/DksA C4-type zinc finger protein [Acinetobacter seifertii]
MADPVDIAEGIAEERIQQTLSNRQTFDGESEHECEECGAEIPERRRALGNVKLCIDCQTAVESKVKHFRGGL